MSSPTEQPGPKPQTTPNEGYSSIVEVYDSIEHVRRRPSMYIGSTDQRGLHRLIEELLCAALDEALAGFCNRITIELLPDGACRVSDNGRGLHFQILKEGFDQEKWRKYKSTDSIFYLAEGALEDLGGWAVNALSAHLEFEIARDGKLWSRKFRQGEHGGDVQFVRDTAHSGTTFTFKPDPEIFGENSSFDIEMLVQRLREVVYLVRNLEILLIDSRVMPTRQESFRCGAGVADFVRNLLLEESEHPIHPHMIYFDGRQENHEFQLAMQWTDAPDKHVLTFANTLRISSGTPLTGFNRGLRSTLTKYARFYGVFKDEKVTGEDCRQGLKAVIALNILDPTWVAKYPAACIALLHNPDINSFVQASMNQWFAAFLECYPDDAIAIGNRALRAYHRRIEAKAARKRRRRSP